MESLLPTSQDVRAVGLPLFNAPTKSGPAGHVPMLRTALLYTAPTYGWHAQQNAPIVFVTILFQEIALLYQLLIRRRDPHLAVRSTHPRRRGAY